jgi:hypothetical protein
MNYRYFACADCKQYIDAGYRWAYWLLEHPNIVTLGEPVSFSAVLAAADYWKPPPDEQSDWLMQQILPGVRRFLADHSGHKVLYLEEEHFYGEGENTIYDGYTEIPTGQNA